jgi:hypothetical protein
VTAKENEAAYPDEPNAECEEHIVVEVEIEKRMREQRTHERDTEYDEAAEEDESEDQDLMVGEGGSVPPFASMRKILMMRRAKERKRRTLRGSLHIGGHSLPRVVPFCLSPAILPCKGSPAN